MKTLNEKAYLKLNYFHFIAFFDNLIRNLTLLQVFRNGTDKIVKPIFYLKIFNSLKIY